MQITQLFPAPLSNENQSITPISWRMISDQVMGGLSDGVMQSTEQLANMQGQVSLENNGGFLQLQSTMPKTLNASQYAGVVIEVCSETDMELQLLIKSSQLWMPWQSFRAAIRTNSNWQQYVIPFSEFKPYKTKTLLNPKSMTTFAVLAGGQVMDVNVSIKMFGFYK